MIASRRGGVVWSVIFVVASAVIGRGESSGLDPQRGQSPAGPSSVSGSPQTDYVIGPEDVLEVAVWKNEALTRTVPVRPDGKISLPLLNDVQAADLTPQRLREVLTKGYMAFVPEPEVSVIVREIHSVKISVVGLVKTPGRYELKSRATVLEALALAGGLTEFAKRDRIFVLRRRGASTVRLAFNYGRMLDSGDEVNFVLEPGDIVVVP
jgi:polysaccharide export outer membrane protein